jgi:hypothetical protein
MALKINFEGDGADRRVAPDVMRLLSEFAGHRDVCDECLAAISTRSGRYCGTGHSLIAQLLEQPTVEMVPD